MTERITNSEAVIDSRDIIERIEELEAEQTEWNENKLVGWTEYDTEELDTLRALTSECDEYSEWTDGAQLIRYSYWVEYVEELLYDCGELPRTIPDYIVIDWEATANAIAYDYSIVDFDGVDYYLRNC
jgi:hypothetical protein